MKNSIISEIFYGNNKNVQNIKMSNAYSKIFDKYCDLMDEFKNCLNNYQNNLFEKISTLNDDMELESYVQYFKEGFKLGLLIGIECMENANP